MGTQVQSEYSSWGVPSNKVRHRKAFAGNDESCVRLGEIGFREGGMRDATRRAASELFAQSMAVTAMIVIAGVIFYVR